MSAQPAFGLGNGRGKLGKAWDNQWLPQLHWERIMLSQAFPKRLPPRVVIFWGNSGYLEFSPATGGRGNTGNPQRIPIWEQLGYSELIPIGILDIAQESPNKSQPGETGDY